MNSSIILSLLTVQPIMWKPSTQLGILIVFSGIVAMSTIACNGDDSASVPSPSIATTTPATSPSPRPAALSVKAAPKPSVSPVQLSPANSQTYDTATDIAMGAMTISKSAVSRQDWSLVASQWQQAINLLKTVPTSSKQHKQAQSKVAQYQRLLADAQEKAAPPPKQAQSAGDITPQYFSIPIKGRIRGTPIIEVSFNGIRKFDMLFDTGANITLITRMIADSLKLKPSGLTKIGVADGAEVLVYQTALKSVEIDGRIKRNMSVVIAPPAMPVGLLGQDFYEGYDISIKQDIIEFRRHSGS